MFLRSLKILLKEKKKHRDKDKEREKEKKEKQKPREEKERRKESSKESRKEVGVKTVEHKPLLGFKLTDKPPSKVSVGDVLVYP